MKSFYFFVLLSFPQTILKAQTTINRDSIQNVWSKSYGKIIKVKTSTDSASQGFAFDKKTHKLLVATSYSRNSNTKSVITDVHFYYHNDSLLWFKVMIQYPQARNQKGYAEYYFVNGLLVKGLQKGRVVSDYSYLLPQAYTLLELGYKLLNSKQR